MSKRNETKGLVHRLHLLLIQVLDRGPQADPGICAVNLKNVRIAMNGGANVVDGDNIASSTFRKCMMTNFLHRKPTITI